MVDLKADLRDDLSVDKTVALWAVLMAASMDYDLAD